MLTILAFPLLYVTGALLIFCGVAPGQLSGDPSFLDHALLTGFGLVCIAFGLFLHRECRRCRDVPGYFAEHYSPFRDLGGEDR